MVQSAIQVQDLSKRYHIGRRQGYQTLREKLTDLAAAPFRRLRSFGRSSDREEDTIWALRDVSFEVASGEVIGIIGRNGSGKSTLLKILSRITEPTSGRAELRGRVGSLLEVGTGFHPELSGRENVFLSGAILGMSRREIREQFDQIVDFSGIGKFLDTPVKRYSSGMRVRLGFSVAAHLKPEILLVDEVLAVGDAEFQKQCLGKMGDVAHQGRTVLFVSHNMDAVLKLCGRTVLLANGRCVCCGPTADVVERYLEAACGQHSGLVDLREHAGRPNGMRRMIQSLGLLAEGSTTRYRTTVKTGDGLVLQVRYDTGNASLDYAVLGISSLLGERVCTVGTHLCPEFRGPFRGQGVLECRLPHVPLADGEYNVLVAIGTRTPPQVLDEVTEALRFRVECGNYFGTGTTLLRRQGYLAQRSQWSVKQPNAGPTADTPPIRGPSVAAARERT